MASTAEVLAAMDPREGAAALDALPEFNKLAVMGELSRAELGRVLAAMAGPARATLLEQLGDSEEALLMLAEAAAMRSSSSLAVSSASSRNRACLSLKCR